MRRRWVIEGRVTVLNGRPVTLEWKEIKRFWRKSTAQHRMQGYIELQREKSLEHLFITTHFEYQVVYR